MIPLASLIRLAFEEYLLIGVASDLFPNDLLNREGRGPWVRTLVLWLKMCAPGGAFSMSTGG